MRLILFTGKGGVGKTTLAAATSVLCAKRGYRTLVISTDAAHSLSDSLEVQLGNEPTEIVPNLHGREVNALEEIERKWGDIRIYLAEFFASQGLDAVEAEELSVFPGMEELFSLMEIRNYRTSGTYDVIVVDCAPTGDTLRLLSAPEITNWYLKHIFPIQRTAAKAVRPVVSRILPFPFPEDRIFEAIKKLTLQLADMKSILEDAQHTSIRLVVNLEKMVIKEAQRAYTFFNLFGFSVDAIIVNRVFPPEIVDPYFDRWKSIQSGYRQMIKDIFAPLPLFSLPLFSQEVVGLPLLEKIADAVYGGEDPARVFSARSPIEVHKADGRYVLSLHLPFLDKSDIDLTQKGEELIVKAGTFKRNILLPRILLHKTVQGAKYEGDWLRITFAPQAREGGH